MPQLVIGLIGLIVIYYFLKKFNKLSEIDTYYEYNTYKFKKGVLMEGKRVKMTLLLDGETIQLLKDYSYQKTGNTNVSKAVMSIAKEHDKERRQQKKDS